MKHLLRGSFPGAEEPYRSCHYYETDWHHCLYNYISTLEDTDPSIRRRQINESCLPSIMSSALRRIIFKLNLWNFMFIFIVQKSYKDICITFSNNNYKFLYLIYLIYLIIEKIYLTHVCNIYAKTR